ncbi:hypothetical protein Hypma_002113 [Hypsizygus marmoreus]|uniref:Uncharacterized protein n=1 Tax=Hypsizygus marmoreus TaxID=39966 RepID=A0A369JZP4_HYPMA|nr:hypothetical protein Hypma_002113 [Hypsizygus marmoreus]
MLNSLKRQIHIRPFKVSETPMPRSALMDHQGDNTVPQLLQQGTPMTKISSKKHKRAMFRLDADPRELQDASPNP